MKYALLFNEPVDLKQRNDPEQSPAYWAAWGAYVTAMGESGIVRGGEGLQSPDTATIVRVKDGKRQVHDGPYAETKDMLGGFFIIEVPDLDVALEWASRAPCASYGYTEVRPLLMQEPPKP